MVRRCPDARSAIDAPKSDRGRGVACHADCVRRAFRLLGVVALLVVAASSPLMGFAAAENFESRKFYGIFEGDWFALFGLVAGAACLWWAVTVARRP